MQEAELSEPDRQRQSALWFHNLFAARIEMGDETQRPGTVFGCRDCGAYTWRRRTKLLAQCPQRPTSQPMREQKERMATGLFPGDRQWTIGIQRMLTPQEMDWLSGEVRTEVAVGQQAETLDSPDTAVVEGIGDEDRLIKEFGLDRVEWAWWANQAMDGPR